MAGKCGIYQLIQQIIETQREVEVILKKGSHILGKVQEQSPFYIVMIDNNRERREIHWTDVKMIIPQQAQK